LDNKRYGPFRTSKDISLGTFQLELPEEWTICNVFNENLLIQCVEPKFKGQYEKLALLPTMKKKNMKWKKLGNIGNKVKKHNISCIGRAMEMNMTNGLQKMDCLMLERQLKTIKQGV